MADQSDVENALVSLVSSGLYPNGTDAASVPGPDCRIYRGWPNSAALDRIWQPARSTSRCFPAVAQAARRRATLSNGSGPGRAVADRRGRRHFGDIWRQRRIGQIAGILVDGRSYAYRTQTGDTPELVAANLAAMARDNSIVRLSRGTLTIAGAGTLLARVVADAPVQQEVRRQEQDFRVTCWCPTPASRDSAAAAIDQVAEQHPLPRIAGRNAGQADLFRNDRIRPIAECQSVSAGPDVQRGIRHDTVRLAARDAVWQPRAQCRELHCLNIWRLPWTCIWSW